MSPRPYRLRLVREQDDSLPAAQINNAAQAAAYLKDHVFGTNPEDSWREKAFLLTLDSERNVCGVFHLSSGGFSGTDFDPYLVTLISVNAGAHSVILAHNHPSGRPTPGSGDLEMTEHCKRYLNAVTTSLMDHIILGENTFFSFSENRETKYPRSNA